MTLSNHNLKATDRLEQRVADLTELEGAYLELIELMLEGQLQDNEEKIPS